MVQPLRRGHPGPVRHRTHRGDDDRTPHDRRTHLARRPGTDVARRRGGGRRRSLVNSSGVVLRGAPTAGARSDAHRRWCRRRRRSRGLPDDPRQHAGRRFGRLRTRQDAQAHRQSSAGPAYPASRAHRRQLRGPGPAGRRSRCAWRCGAVVEAGAKLRRPVDLDRTGGSSPGRERPGRRRVPGQPLGRPVGAVQPRHRSRRVAQPVA